MLAPATGAANDAAARERPTALDVVAPPGCGWSYFVAAATRHPEQLVRAGGPRRGGSRREELRVELVPADLTPFQTRVVVLSCVIVLATAVGWLAGQPSTRDWFVRRPYAAAALVGFAAWAWLQPSWLGLLIAVASVFLWLREMLRARAAHVPGSSATTVTSCD